MKSRISQDDKLSYPCDNFKDHYALVLILTSTQDVTEKYQDPELVGKPLRLELNFAYHLQNVTQLNVLENKMSTVAVEKFGVVGNNLDN